MGRIAITFNFIRNLTGILVNEWEQLMGILISPKPTHDGRRIWPFEKNPL